MTRLRSIQIVEYKLTQKEFTATKLIEKVNNHTSSNTMQDLIVSEIDRLKQESRLKSAIIYKELRTSLLEFNKHLDVYFSDIDVNFLKSYEAFLRKKGLTENSMGIRFRTLRAIFNKAISSNIVKEECYTFRIYKVSKLHKETVKLAIQ